MSWTGFIVLFSVIWFVTLWCNLMVGVRSQDEDGEIVPGTPPGAPADLNLKRKLWTTTLIAFLIWLPIILIIVYGGITVRDLDWFGLLDDPIWDDI